MRKIPTVFQRAYLTDPKHVLDAVTPGCEWALDPTSGAWATRKWNGTCTFLDSDGNWWARREIKIDQHIPDTFWEVHFDEQTGKRFGWLPMHESQYAAIHAEALINSPLATTFGTYELMGPKINKNPEGFDQHVLVKHGLDRIDNVPTTFDELRAFLTKLHEDGIEGIVWYSPGGSFAKLKYRDFA